MPNFLVVTDPPDTAHISAEGELWAPQLADLRTRLLALVAHGCHEIDIDLSQARPGFLASELLTEVVALAPSTCTVTVVGWRAAEDVGAPAPAASEPAHVR